MIDYERRDFESIYPQAQDYSFSNGRYYEANPLVKKSLPLIEIQRMWLVYKKATRPLRQSIKKLKYQIEELKITAKGS
jgi:hypothetical protein